MKVNEMIELLDALPRDVKERHVMFYMDGAYYDVDGFVLGRGALGGSIVLMEGTEGND